MIIKVIIFLVALVVSAIGTASLFNLDVVQVTQTQKNLHYLVFMLLFVLPFICAVLAMFINIANKEGYQKGLNDGINQKFEQVIKTDTLYIPKP